MTTTTAGSDAGRVKELQARAHDKCTPVLREWVSRLPEPLRHLAGYHFGWWDTTGAPTNGTAGKALRPMLAFASAAAYGGNEDAATPAAVAIELLHNFSLIHDDMLDGDHTRRGRATVWSVWGVADGVLLGDALHALAIQVLAAGLPSSVAGAAVARLGQAAIDMCRGQSDDCRFETRFDVGIADYERMAMGKTGTLIGCACALGTLCAGADAQTVASMDAFGRALGLVFQFVDDLLGIWGDPAVTGKPVGNDLARRKRSLPVIAALASGTPAAVALNRLYRLDMPLDSATVAEAAALIECAGGRQATTRRVEQQLATALGLLSDGPPSADLIAIAHLIGHRDR